MWQVGAPGGRREARAAAVVARAEQHLERRRARVVRVLQLLVQELRGAVVACGDRSLRRRRLDARRRFILKRCTSWSSSHGSSRKTFRKVVVSGETWPKALGMVVVPRCGERAIDTDRLRCGFRARMQAMISHPQ